MANIRPHAIRAAVAVSALMLAMPSPALAVSIGSSVIVEASRTDKINDMYKLDGIRYIVYTDQACTTVAKDVDGHDAVLVVAYDSNTQTAKTPKVELEPGTYYVKEDPASVEGTGLTVDTEVHECKVTSDHTEDKPFSLKSTEDVVRTDKGRIIKLDDDFGATPAGDGTLAGAIVRVDYFDTPQPHEAEWFKQHRSEALATWYFTTDANGQIDMSTAQVASGKTSSNFKMANGKRVFLLGSYLIQEVQAPVGYQLNDEVQVMRLTQRSATTTAPNGELDFEVEDEIVPQIITIEKRDKEIASGQDDTAARDAEAAKHVRFLTGSAMPSATTVQGDTNHESTYRVQNISEHSITYVTKGNVEVEVKPQGYLPDEFTCMVDDSGKWVTPQIKVSYGTYRITEIAAGEGMHVDSSWVQKVEAHRDEANSSKVYEFTQLNIPVRGSLGLVKVDSDTQKSWTISNGHSINTILGDVIAGQGDATLVGAEFTVKNASKSGVLVDGKWYAPGADICVLTTYKDEDGNVVAYMPTNKSLPYGTYEVRETKAPQGYHKREGILGGEKLVLHPEASEDGSWAFAGWVV